MFPPPQKKNSKFYYFHMENPSNRRFKPAKSHHNNWDERYQVLLHLWIPHMQVFEETVCHLDRCSFLWFYRSQPALCLHLSHGPRACDLLQSSRRSKRPSTTQAETFSMCRDDINVHRIYMQNKTGSALE